MGYFLPSACRCYPLLGRLHSGSLLCQALSRSLRSDCSNVNSERKGINKPNTLLIFVYILGLHIFASVNKVHCMYSGYVRLSPTKIPPFCPLFWKLPVSMASHKGYGDFWTTFSFPFYGLSISHGQRIPTGQQSLWPLFSLWQIM